MHRVSQRKAQLAEAALAILTSQGARALTVKAIAGRVGISDGAVFRHFPDVQALFDAAVCLFEESLPALPDASQSAETRLAEFFVGRTRAVQARPHVLGLAMDDRLLELAGKNAARRIRRIQRTSMKFLFQCLGDLHADGQLNADVDEKILAWMITGAMKGAAQSGLDPQKAWVQVARVLFTPKERS
jgi:AcrR family transcriptional regulator